MNTQEYTPNKVWRFEDIPNLGGKYGNTNKPTAGARHQQTLPRGNKPIQLYSLNTPNGIKVNILLEELKSLGIQQAEYDAYKINILENQQFGSDFTKINPNSKIPALIDQSNDDEVLLFESGAILLYLAEKFQQFIPLEQGQQRAECLSWLMWQMGSAPYVGGGFGHFYAYAPEPMEYPINRFTMETKRQLDLLNSHLSDREYICEYGYSIADMAIFPWYAGLVLYDQYQASNFLNVSEYQHVIRWAKQLDNRPAVQQARQLELQQLDRQ